MSTGRPRIIVQDVLSMLKKGKSREEIREFYGLTKTDLKNLFKHDKLKGKKTHKKPGFIVVDAEARPVDDESQSNVAETPVRDFRNVDDSPSNSDDSNEEEEDLSGRETFGGDAS